MSTILVGQIEQQLSQNNERRMHTKLGDVSVSDDGHYVLVDPSEGTDGETQRFEFDEVTERAFAKFLDVNPSYLSKCPSSLKATNLNHWLRTEADAEAMFTIGGHGIATMYDPDQTVLTIPEIAGVISRVFAPEDEIVTLHSDPDKFHADIVIQSSHITVPGNGVGDRPDANGNLYVRPEEEGGQATTKPNVFDITHGGVRILAHPSKSKAPTVERYFNRYICSNGMTMPIADRQITLRGKTVEEVLESMEEVANELMTDMPQALEQYAALAEIAVPGNPINFIQQVGREQGIPSRLIQQAIQFAGGMNLGRDDVATTYDVMNIFTSLANMESVRYSTATRLQRMGGEFVRQGEEMTRRCGSCEQPIGFISHVHG